MRLSAALRKSGERAKTLWPGPGVDLAKDADLEKFIKENAWGHHACGSCKIGKDGDVAAVLDGDFRVRGVAGLRVVDASAFPDIPGYFLAAPVYQISEKASEVILGERHY